MQRDLTELTGDELVDLIAQYAHEQAVKFEEGNIRRANRAVDALYLVNRELRQRGPEEHRRLLRLLSHDELEVRLWSAGFVLECAPEEGEAELERITVGPRSTSRLSAEMTLREWRAGRLKFP